MCGLKAAQIHDRPFRAAKDDVQTLAALDSFLPNGKKILIWHHLSSLDQRHFYTIIVARYKLQHNIFRAGASLVGGTGVQDNPIFEQGGGVTVCFDHPTFEKNNAVILENLDRFLNHF